MNNDFAEYVGNIIASALLAGSEERNEQLRKEHAEVIKKLKWMTKEKD